MYGEVRAYKVLRHQHVPEIELALGRVGAGGAPRVVLTTHLLPVARGIFATMTARLARPVATAELVARYRDDFADDPTVSIAETAEDVSLRARRRHEHVPDRRRERRARRSSSSRPRSTTC